MKTSEQINELAEALGLAQGEFPTIERTETAKMDSDRAKYSYRYANLAGVLEAVRAALAKNGLAIIQSPHTPEAGKISITLMLLHKSGQWMEDTFSMPCTQQTPQGIGSIISYARRYQLLSFLGLATDDDDGHEAEQTQQRTQSGNRQRSTPRAENDSTQPIQTEQMAKITQICQQHGWGMEETAQQWYQLSVENLTQLQARDMITKLLKLAQKATQQPQQPQEAQTTQGASARN
jgi:hypothetical protein